MSEFKLVCIFAERRVPALSGIVLLFCTAALYARYGLGSPPLGLILAMIAGFFASPLLVSRNYFPYAPSDRLCGKTSKTGKPL